MSENAQHTAGPWQVTTGVSGQPWIYRYAPNGGVHSTIFDGDAPSEWPLSEADKRLIEATPEMLAALTKVREITREMTGRGREAILGLRLYEAVTPAIATATGQDEREMS